MKTTKPTRRARRLRFALRAFSLSLFLALLALTRDPVPDLPAPLNLFLRLDPLAAVGIPLAQRQWIGLLLPGLGILLLAFFAGRLFCGYICPMGITLSLARAIAARRFAARRAADAGQAGAERRAAASAREGGDTLPLHWRHGKYLFLAGILAAALAGVNTAFWMSPISLITRLYALLIHPLLLLAGRESLTALHPLFDVMDWTSLSYAQIPLRRFDTLYVVAVFFGALFWLERRHPYFWCRCCCPAGALLALCSFQPLRRRVVHTCTGCGACVRHCPANAVDPTGKAARHGECLHCRACVDLCPTQGVSFGFYPRRSPQSAGASALPGRGRPDIPFPVPALPSRRAFLTAAGTGALLAGIQIAGAHSLLHADSRGLLWPNACVRPPGALPEPDFVNRCIRCGQCMKVCPTNGLQPSWLSAGPDGVFSPVLEARRGPCEPRCNACGAVCPTGAIQALPMREKIWAKIGTAVIRQDICLAWSRGKRCVVCDEVCPYGAVTCIQTPHSLVSAPIVKEHKCFGCGYCEQFCPTRIPAVVVMPLNAMRLASGGNYRQNGQSVGLDLRLDCKSAEKYPQNALPEGELPPGFSH
jgi:ferredoxin